MNKITLLICLVMTVVGLNAQNRTIDSLYNELKQAKHDTTRVKVYVDLSNNYFSFQPDSVLPNCQKAVKLARKNLATAKSTPLKFFYATYLSSALDNIGVFYMRQGDFIKSIDYTNQSLEISKSVNDTVGIIACYSNLGYAFENNGDIPKALEFYYKGLKMQENVSDKVGIARSLNNIGFIYQKQNDLSKALELHFKSLKIMEELDNKYGMARSLHNIGAIYRIQGELSKALSCHQRALKLQEEIDHKRGMAYSLIGIGLIYNDQGESSKAIDFIQKSLKISEEIQDNTNLVNALENLANITLKQGNTSKALEYANRCLIVAKELGYPEEIKYAALTLKDIYQKQNKHLDALKMYELYIQMKDSVFNEETRKSSIKKQFQYEYEKQATKDSISNVTKMLAEQLRHEQEISQQKTITYVGFAGLAFMFLLAGVSFKAYKNKQRASIIIENQKHILEEKHKEITDSINYAERIQRSFLATKELLDENLNEYFVLFKPKDIVSGDFYWASFAKASSANGNRDLFYLATADSTGHGVPGAIMSLLNITSIELAIKDGYHEPSKILDATRQTIIERLKKDGSIDGGKDGMDVSLTMYDFVNKKLSIAAANNPVWIVRTLTNNEKEVIEIKPDKMPVGKHDKQNTSFTQQEIQLYSGDIVYTLTDGFPDQFGGNEGKKFMSKNLRELLLSNSHLPLVEQKQLLEKTFDSWKNNLEQVDDVTIIGVRV